MGLVFFLIYAALVLLLLLGERAFAYRGEANSFGWLFLYHMLPLGWLLRSVLGETLMHESALWLLLLLQGLIVFAIGALIGHLWSKRPKH